MRKSLLAVGAGASARAVCLFALAFALNNFAAVGQRRGQRGGVRPGQGQPTQNVPPAPAGNTRDNPVEPSPAPRADAGRQLR